MLACLQAFCSAMEGVPDFYVEPLWQLYGMVRTPSPMCMRLQRACVHTHCSTAVYHSQLPTLLRVPPHGKAAGWITWCACHPTPIPLPPQVSSGMVSNCMAEFDDVAKDADVARQLEELEGLLLQKGRPVDVPG